MNGRRLRTLSILVALCSPAFAEAPITVENAWIPLSAPEVQVHAAYMTILNRSAADQDILAATSPDYERTELHRSVIENGVSTMQPVERVTVPANGTVELAPAGLHLMLIGPHRSLVSDSRVHIILRLSGGEELELSAVVRRREDAPHGAHTHH
jgi:periplasmic copper chaperone A